MIIGRYLFFQFFKSIFAVLIFTLTIYLTLTYIEDSQFYFPDAGVPAKTIFFFYFWQLPSITIELLPFTVLVGSIITNWVLAKNGEIAALRAAGLSMLKIATPLILVGLCFTAFHFYLSELVIPYTSTQYLKVRHVDIEKLHKGNIFSESKWLRSQNSILHYDQYDEIKQKLEKPELFVYNSNGLAKDIVQAKSAYFDENINYWVLHYAIISHFNSSSKLTNI
jgi:lipopolysaccharide export system permease protein